MGSVSFDALVLDAGFRQSLVTVRSLGHRGLEVAALDRRSNAPAFSSRWCRRALVCPAMPATSEYLDYLEQALASTHAPVVIPSADATVDLLRRHRERLTSSVRIAVADEPAMAIAVDKARTLAVARDLGIRVPRSVMVRSIADVPDAVKEIGLPAVIKPGQSWLWGDDAGIRVDSAVVTTVDEAYRAVDGLTRLGDVPLCQELLSGRREAVSFLYANGEMHARFAQWAKRTCPPLGGESVLRQSIPVPGDIGEQAERLVREIDLAGYSEVEFRRDDAGIPFLMEINPRLSASVEIAVRSGVDFPYLVYQWASGARIDTVRSYRAGGWMRHLRGDLMTTLAALRRRGRPEVARPLPALLGFGLSFFKPMGYDYVDWSDPLPAVRAVGQFLREFTYGAVRVASEKIRS